MSYKARALKRQDAVRHRAVVNAAKGTWSVATAARYYLRDAKRPGRCAARGCVIRRGDQIVYRHKPRLTLCLSCAQGDPLISPEVRLSVRSKLRRPPDAVRRGCVTDGQAGLGARSAPAAAGSSFDR